MALDDTTNSYGLLIRDGWLARMRTRLPFATALHVAKTKARPVQMSLPYLGVYIVDEVLTADGDVNQGAPHYINTLRLGISWIIKNDDPEVAEQQLDNAYWVVQNGMLRAQNWFRMPDIKIRDWKDKLVPLDIESIPRIARSHLFGNVGLTNETPMVELRLEMNFMYRTFWPPIVTDDLKKVHVETHYPYPSDGIQPVISSYDIESE